MATESISSELCKCVKDLILLVEQRSFGEPDLIRFRVDWLCNVVVRYVDHIPSGEAVLNLMHEAAVLLVTDSDDDHGNPKQRQCSLANGEDLAILFQRINLSSY